MVFMACAGAEVSGNRLRTQYGDMPREVPMKIQGAGFARPDRRAMVMVTGEVV